MIRLVKKSAGYALVFVIGGLVVFILADLIVSMKLPPLRPWHTIKLEHEFKADMETAFDWEQYLQQEQKLFDELDSHKDGITAAIELYGSRYQAGGNRLGIPACEL